MRDWRAKLDAFLTFNEREILGDAGRVSMEVAKALALEAYDVFTHRRLAEEAAAPDEFEVEAKRIEGEAPPRPPGTGTGTGEGPNGEGGDDGEEP